MPEFEPVTRDVLDLASEIIAKYHEHLLDARIGFVFRDRGLRVAGKMRAAAISRVTAMNEVAGLHLDFLCWISQEDWDQMSAHQRRALIDHELCHARGEPGMWAIVGHDVEEFGVIIQRYGLYSTALERISQAMQPYLPSIDVSARGAVVTFERGQKELLDILKEA
jgi:hypothetical protein